MLKTLKTNFLSSSLWFVLVAIGFPLGYLAGNFLTKDFDDYHNEFALSITLLLFVIGLFIGLGQWIALNKRIKVLWTWIPATAIGFSLGCTVSYFLVAIIGQFIFRFDDPAGKYDAVSTWVLPCAAFLGAGMLCGLFQWLALERVEQISVPWLLVSGLCFACSFGLANLILISSSRQNFYGDYLLWFAIIMGIILAFLTSISAGLLILRPKYQEP